MGSYFWWREFPGAWRSSANGDAAVQSPKPLGATTRTTVIQALNNWVEVHFEQLNAAGVFIEAHDPVDLGEERSMGVELKQDSRQADVIVWTTGDAEFHLFDHSTGEFKPLARRMESKDELDEFLAPVLVWFSV